MLYYRLEWREGNRSSWQALQTDDQGFIKVAEADASKFRSAEFRVLPVPAGRTATPPTQVWDQLRTHAVKPPQEPLVAGLKDMGLPANGEDLAGYSFDTFWEVHRAISEIASELIGCFYDEHSARTFAAKSVNVGYHGLSPIERKISVLTRTGTYVGWPVTIGEKSVAAATDEQTHLRIRGLAKLTPEERAALGV